jgi:hypothetical protein
MAEFIQRMRRIGASEGSYEIASAFGLAMTGEKVAFISHNLIRKGRTRWIIY